MTDVKEFQFSDNFVVNDEMKKHFETHGYILIKNFLDNEELDIIQKAVQGDCFTKNIYGDVENGFKTDKVLWKHPGNDVTGMLARCEKMVNTAESLLGGEVYHYHTKLMMKNPKKGAKHVWHQDYGYWYHNGCLFPDMLTVFIPLDPCKKENSCLQMLRGSHRCGRIQHHVVGEQYGCKLDRVNEIRQVCPHQYMEMDRGDAIFFHCNVIHCSSDNESDKRRWAFLTAYNKATNNPTKVHHHPQYTPLEKVSNDSIKTCTNFTDMTGKIFVDPARDLEYKGNFKNVSED